LAWSSSSTPRGSTVTTKGDLLPGREFQPVAGRHFSPPTCTKTWFHQGPVESDDGEWHELDREGEYWPGDPSLLDHRQGIEGLLRNLPRPARRDALRALRGSMLRTELYALDGHPARESRPYTVVESAFALVKIDEEAEPPDGYEPLMVFFPHSIAQRTTQWERGGDPLTASPSRAVRRLRPAAGADAGGVPARLEQHG